MSVFSIKASPKEQIVFARNMALMIKSSIPLLSCLKLMEEQTRSSGMKKILASVRTDVENGQLLSASFKKFEAGLGRLFISVIQVGEASGTLADNLSLLADELKKKQVLKGKVLNAMIYPSVIVAISFGLIFLLLFFVFPKILPLFQSLNVKLPLTTRILIASSDFVRGNVLLIIVALIVGGIGFSLLMRLASFRYFLQKTMLRMPVVGPLFQGIQMAVIARTLLVLLHSGVKIVDAINITADITTNLVYERALRAAAVNVRAGEPLAKSLALYPQLFPIMFTQMLEVSETAGTLDTTLSYLNDYYEVEVDDKLANFIALLEPLLLVTMGLVVAVMAVSMILPIYSLTSGLSPK